MSTLNLHSLLSDDAVLQRDEPITIRGTAAPGATIEVCFDGETARATADAEGHWMVRLAARDASGPHRLVCTAGEERVVRTGIYVGEVWFCSGQSNMEWPLAQSSQAEAEVFAARIPELHLFTAPLRPSATECADFPPATCWRVCTPDTAPLFSAVAFHFGRCLLPTLRCHIGLIVSAWGGTMALPWTPAAALAEDPVLAPQLAMLETVTELKAPALAPRYEDEGIAETARGWEAASLSPAGWSTIELPCLWQDRGMWFNGAVWFRREVDIPETWAGRPLMLELGVIDDYDMTWFNGEYAGGIGPEHPSAWCTQRQYRISPELVQSGKSVIAVRVFDAFGCGGMSGPGSCMRLSLESEPGNAIDLAGNWNCRVELALPKPPPEESEGHTLPTALYNGMVSPAVHFPLRGFAWYQGESDLPRAELYTRILSTLVEGWRTVWGAGPSGSARPFLIVQLANFADPGNPLADHTWPRLREAQTRCAAELPAVDFAVAIDVGEAGDIHPIDKRSIGHRLAGLALDLAYGLPCAPGRGPRYQRHEIEGDAIRVWFDYQAPGLRSRDGGPLSGFVLAGADRQFHPAEAHLEGLTVVVRSDRVHVPASVRYAWSAAPVANLENANRQPAAPFRTDDWP